MLNQFAACFNGNSTKNVYLRDSDEYAYPASRRIRTNHPPHYSLNMKRIVPYLSIVFITLMLAVFLLAPVMRTMGYYVDNPGWEVGEIAAKKGNPNLCSKLKVLWHLFAPAPSATQRRRECIYTYASLTHDPTACEILMPSRYGLDCVGAAMKNDQCNFYGNFTVSWGEGKATLKECQKPDRKRGEKGDQCCIIASVSFLRSFNNCSSLLGDQVMFDECQFSLAFKNHDPASCDPIQDDNMRAACLVDARALKKDPSICTGCTPPVDSIDDLPK